MCTVGSLTNVQPAVGRARTGCDASIVRSNERTTVPETTTGSARPSSAARPDPSPPPALPPANRAWLLAALLGATVLGTISNNIVNVPLRQITTDFGVPVTQGVLIASASVLVLAVAMPLTGWVSDRLGRRRTLVLALGVLLLGTIGATLRPFVDPDGDQPCPAGARAARAVPVAVMGTLARTFPPGAAQQRDGCLGRGQRHRPGDRPPGRRVHRRCVRLAGDLRRADPGDDRGPGPDAAGRPPGQRSARPHRLGRRRIPDGRGRPCS